MTTILIENYFANNGERLYMASIEDVGFSSGRSPAEALGSLIFSNPERYGLVLKDVSTPLEDDPDMDEQMSSDRAQLNL